MDGTAHNHQLPSVLPDGHALLMPTLPHVYGTRARVEAVSLPNGERKVLVEDGADARYLSTGHLVFVRKRVLMAAPFDAQRLELTAPPVLAVEGVSQALHSGGGDESSAAGQFTVSDSGLLAYAPGGPGPPSPIELLLVDESGRPEPLLGFDKPLVSPLVRYSPDGHELAVVEQDRSGLFWLFDVERQTFRALSDRGIAASPRWSLDGTRLVLGWSEEGPFQLWLVPTIVRDDWERLTTGEHMQWSPSWSPDGRFPAFVREGPPSADILIYRFEDRQAVPFLASPALELYPEFSPDGRWLADASDESGRFEVYVTSFPDRDQTVTVSRRGGEAPAWSRDGSRLFYYSPWSPDDTRSMMAVAVRSSPKLSLGITRFPVSAAREIRGHRDTRLRASPRWPAVPRRTIREDGSATADHPPHPRPQPVRRARAARSDAEVGGRSGSMLP